MTQTIKSSPLWADISQIFQAEKQCQCSGCRIEVKNMPHDPDVVGSNLRQMLGFFLQKQIDKMINTSPPSLWFQYFNYGYYDLSNES